MCDEPRFKRRRNTEKHLEDSDKIASLEPCNSGNGEETISSRVEDVPANEATLSHSAAEETFEETETSTKAGTVKILLKQHEEEDHEKTHDAHVPHEESTYQHNDSIARDCQWPWIRLTDNKGRVYYYNALTSKTAWTPGTQDVPCDAAKPTPPTAYSAALAQKAWQDFWKQCEASKHLLPDSPHAHDTKHDAGDQSSSETQNVSKSMAIYIEHYKSPTAVDLGRGARQQVRPPSTDAVGYVQGFDEYNIWYGKYLSDRREGGRREDREKATTRCNPFTDSGWTRCDMEPQLDRPVICLYFAKGCCYLGSNCRYYHRIPTVEDDRKLDMLHDIFGRERFAAHRDDMDGVGTFSEDCRTLFVGDMKVNRVYSNAEEKTEELIRQQFGLWGPIESVRVIRNKNIAFVRYKYRVHAEFAKVAMAEQRLLLDRSDDQISVRWAHPGRDTSKEERTDVSQTDWEQANNAVMNRLQALGYSQEDINCQLKWSIQDMNQKNMPSNENTLHSVVSSYPNTESRFPSKDIQQEIPVSDSNESSQELYPGDEHGSLDVSCPRLHNAFSRLENAQSEDIFKVII